MSRRFVMSARRIQRFWESIPYPVLEGSFLGGPAYAMAEMVVTLRGLGDGFDEPNW